MEQSEEKEGLEKSLADVRMQLEEANDIINAIRTGEVDALVVNGKDGHKLFTLKSADQTYRIFIEQMTESAVTLDARHQILYCNSQFAKLLGMRLEKMIGLKFLNLINEADREKAIEVLANSWERDERAELSLKNKDGRSIPVQLSLKTLELEEGFSLSIVLTDLSNLKSAQDLLQQKNEELEKAHHITEELNNNLEKTVKLRTSQLEANIKEKTQVEEVLRLNGQRLTSILQTMGEGLCIHNKNGKVTFANQRAQKLFGLAEKQILGRDFFDLTKECTNLTGVALHRNEHPVGRVFSSLQSVYDHEIAIVNENNDKLYISINATPLTEDGELSEVVMTFTDVSNRRKIELQKDEFISVASHEIKTPLTSLKASMQLLSRIMTNTPDSDKIPFLMQKANDNLSKVVHLAEDLMNFSKIQQGPLPLKKTFIKPIDLILSCTENLFHQNGPQLVVDGDQQITVFADGQRIEQVLVNLLNNALKYAPDSQQIKVSVSEENEMVKVAVQDFGKGIAKEKLPHLFNRYYQVNPQGKQVSGLGLGLYISYEIIQRHKGTMFVESEVGKGTTFFFTLPKSSRAK